MNLRKMLMDNLDYLSEDIRLSKTTQMIEAFPDRMEVADRFADMLSSDDLSSDSKIAQRCVDEAVRTVKRNKDLQEMIISDDVLNLSDETVHDLTKTDFEIRFIDGDNQNQQVRSNHLPKNELLRKYTIGLADALFSWSVTAATSNRTVLMLYMKDGRKRAFLMESNHHAEALHDLSKWTNEGKRLSQISYRTSDGALHVMDSSVYGSLVVKREDVSDDVEIVVASDDVQEIVAHIAESKRIQFEEPAEYWYSRFP